MSTRTSAPVRPHARQARGATRAFARGPLPILVACLLWGSTGTVASFAPAGAGPAAVGCSGLLFGGLLLFVTTRGAWALLRGASGRELRALALGAVAVAGYPVTFYPAVARCGVAVATVVALGVAPLFAGLAERSAGGARWWAATTAAVAGCALLVVGQDAAGARADLVGVGLAVAAGLSYAVYATVGARLIAAGRRSRPVLGVMFAGAAVLVAPLVVADGGWLASGRGLAVAAHLSVLTTFAAYTLFGFGLRWTTAATATALTLAEPAAAAVLAVVVLGEPMAALSWAGLAVTGVALGALTLSRG
ncbi:DMT family transporter [Yinghuangia seranimata]|uniref:DMT family transporter n=1 Tax=Yinghuangia seranimata TaxID=408067 RepID=UPI00248CF702|nr:DMT family transporter [Yinghuangia seranimata]MDI2125553.1 DMT family transporter [Yinghuangia seranimata]